MDDYTEYLDRVARGPPFAEGEEMKYVLVRLATLNKLGITAYDRLSLLANIGIYHHEESGNFVCFNCSEKWPHRATSLEILFPHGSECSTVPRNATASSSSTDHVDSLSTTHTASAVCQGTPGHARNTDSASDHSDQGYNSDNVQGGENRNRKSRIAADSDCQVAQKSYEQRSSTGVSITLKCVKSLFNMSICKTRKAAVSHDHIFTY